MTIKNLAIFPAIAIALASSISLGQYPPRPGDPPRIQDSQTPSNSDRLTNSDRLAEYRKRIDAKISQSQPKMITTRDGNVIFQFPNYDIAIGGTPSYPGQGNGTPSGLDVGGGQVRSSSTRVIWKSDNGYSWDGSNFLLSPNYSYDLYTGDRFRRQIIGQPDKFWTPTLSEPSHDGGFGPSLDDETSALLFVPTATKSARTLEWMHSSLLPQATWDPLRQGQATGKQVGEKGAKKLELDEMESQPPSRLRTGRFGPAYQTQPSFRFSSPQTPPLNPPTLNPSPAKSNRSLNSNNIEFLRNGLKPSSTTPPLPSPANRQDNTVPVR